jgi:hypothetical protein
MMSNLIDLIKFSASAMLGSIIGIILGFIAVAVASILITEVFIPFLIWAV